MGQEDGRRQAVGITVREGRDKHVYWEREETGQREGEHLSLLLLLRIMAFPSSFDDFRQAM